MDKTTETINSTKDAATAVMEKASDMKDTATGAIDEAKNKIMSTTNGAVDAAKEAVSSEEEPEYNQ